MELQVLDWRMQVDPEATRQAHESMPQGGAESCGCLYCRNFIASRDRAYPPEALDLFHSLGVRSDRETEIGAPLRLAEGCWLYGGWFHFVGRIVEGPKRPGRTAQLPAKGGVRGGAVRVLDYRPLADGFGIAFADQAHLLPEPLKGEKVVQLEFSTEVPWGLSDPEPES